MRLFERVNQRSRQFFVAAIACLLVACGGSGGQDPILGTPGIATAPRVILTTPAKLVPIASGIATNMAITAKFSRDMLSSSLNTSSFTVACPSGSPVTGTVTYDTVNRIAVFQHAAAFPISTTCEATITTAAMDTAQIHLAKNYVWDFTTGTSADTTLPTVIANSPLNNATAVCLSKPVNVTFSEAMDSSTITSSTFYLTDPLSAVVPGLISYDSLSHTATFAPTDPPGYMATTIYTSHVTTGAKDLAGNALSLANTVSFETGTLSCAPLDTVSLGTVETYGAFGGGAGSTNAGVNTVVNGDLGTTAACTLFTGFHDANNVYTETTLNIGEVTGDIYCGPPAPGTTQKLAIATQAAADALTAYNALAAKTPSTALNSGELGTRTLLAGTYTPAASTLILSTGNLTLDAAGDANAMWVFQVPSSLTIGLIATPRSVLLINGAQAKNVFWQVGSAARIENGSTMVGTIIASAGVTISTAGETAQTTLTGRAIGLNASVTMVNTTIVSP
jgi:hypothetical protein